MRVGFAAACAVFAGGGVAGASPPEGAAAREAPAIESGTDSQATTARDAVAAAVHSNGCLETGDGYLRATLGGAIEAKIDWPNSGTRCQGEPKDKPPGVRLSFQRVAGGSPDLLFVFGVSGVRPGKPARAAGVNLTVIVQGTSRIYGTLGDGRCTVDSLAQRPLKAKNAYRVEARGFCTQPAHAVRGDDEVLMSTFEFAGLVVFDAENDAVNASLGRKSAD